MAGADATRLVGAHPLRMFPTLVWRADLADDVRARINASVLREPEALRRGAPPLARGQGWQSAHDLHLRPSFAELVACIEAAAAGALDFLKVGEGRLAVTACWLNLLAPARAHPAHSHPNNYLSGVYYVRTAPGADTVSFHDPRPQTGVIRPPVAELTADNTDQVTVRVADGTLLLFPAWLTHSVDANQGAQTRISVSFNLMFADYAETMARPLWDPRAEPGQD